MTYWTYFQKGSSPVFMACVIVQDDKAKRSIAMAGIGLSFAYSYMYVIDND